MTQRPQRGFVLGKFMPPHLGHIFLCDFAQAYCESLTVLVCSLDDDPIPGAQRFAWMSQLFPDCDVRWCHEDLPQTPEDHPDFWSIWRDVVERYGGCPDVVFASEDYGHRLAAEVGARFVPVDPARTAVATSGQAVRADPFGNWSYLPAQVRPWFTKRLCLIGPESVGKSTLAAALARHFNGLAVPEYGRTYTDAFGVDVGSDSLRRIVQGQVAATSAARRQGPRLLVEDTDPVLTSVWSVMLTGTREPAADAYSDYADHYLLLDTEVPWIDDGTRYFSATAERQRFFDLCKAEVDRRGLSYSLITGPSWNERTQAAIKATAGAFPSI